MRLATWHVSAQRSESAPRVRKIAIFQIFPEHGKIARTLLNGQI